MKRSWQKLRDGTPRSKRVPTIGIKPVSRLLVSTPVFVIGGVIINTSSRHSAYVRTKSYAPRAFPSSIWYKTTNLPRLSVMSVGLNLSDSLCGNEHGTDDPCA